MTGQDLCMGVIKVKNEEIIIGGVYIHPNTSHSLIYEALKCFVENCSGKPYILCGDFNVDVLKSPKFLEIVEKKFKLVCLNPKMATTRSNTCLDLTFVSKDANFALNVFQYVSYFSYHRPILNRINF